VPPEVAEEIEAAARLLHRARYGIALTGAGLSKESGIPTFRGEGGLWTKHGEPPMNGYQIFMRDPESWWRRRLEQLDAPRDELGIAIAQAQPNAGHHAFVELERLGYLRTVVTQNVDNLHRAAGSERLLEIHGNRTLLRCVECEARWTPDRVPTDELPPRCDRCGGIIKSDTVMFGEPIPPSVLRRCFEAAERADVCLVAGTSVLVTPAADLPFMVLRNGGAVIEANTDETPLTRFSAAALRGPTGVLLPLLVAALKRLDETEPQTRGAGLVRRG
ncbi:MAG TPA: Sir2 family NAD-dependent protein deacetylase, partial [Dehalococcoidia bacterium]|nr:Sir2 family NAD-dependent protein deacetylase [Dehalococcoidia bacterium]